MRSVLTICRISVHATYAPSLHFQLIVNTGGKIMEDDHLTVRWESRLLLQANSHQRLYGSRASDATESWCAHHLLLPLWDIPACPWRSNPSCEAKSTILFFIYKSTFMVGWLEIMKINHYYTNSHYHFFQDWKTNFV